MCDPFTTDLSLVAGGGGGAADLGGGGVGGGQAGTLGTTGIDIERYSY